jgi:putative two-component system response regulator
MATPTDLPLRPTSDVGARSVLVVDDEHGVRDLMCRWLQAIGCEVVSASGAAEALGLIEHSPPAVAVCDIRMPGFDGLWLADRIRRQAPETAVIMASGVHDADTAAARLGNGIVACLTKPFGRERLHEAVARAIEWHLMARDARWWRERLKQEVKARKALLAETISARPIDSDPALRAMLSRVLSRDPDAHQHAVRVASLASAIAGELGLPVEEVGTIRRAALLHDLGKQVLPEAVLRKPAPLTPDERTIVQMYPELGSELIQGMPYLEDAAAIVAEAQERPDGLGYPVGLSDDEVSKAARIIAAVDAYDTMTRSRVFRDALGAAEALLEMDRCSGTQFDPEVVAVLKRLAAVH